MARKDAKFPSEFADAFNVRLPDGMHEMLKKAAAANDRSMNSEVVVRLKGSFSADKALAPALAEMLDSHIEQEVNARLRAIAAQIGGA